MEPSRRPRPQRRRLPSPVPVIPGQVTTTFRQTLKHLFHKIFLFYRQPPKVFECAYCYVAQPRKAFRYPFFFRFHVDTTCVKTLQKMYVCYECIRRSVAAQLDTMPASRIGCPNCGGAWTPPDVVFLLEEGKQEEYWRKLEAEMKTSHPNYTPPPKEVVENHNEQGTKLCPYCSTAIQRRSGCTGMVCPHCQRAFSFNMAKNIGAVHDRYELKAAFGANNVREVRRIGPNFQRELGSWDRVNGKGSRVWVGERVVSG